ncbi:MULTISPECIES: hypothetical protein [unclassified Variovorax]|uniref:hypothetical protein n=1 Tax=unclassified Variovorax TaxID=663243 RepID=UPI00076CF1E2|nr:MULTISPECIES: hypothetical protein [unclassified Variovorax]KWT64461.1 hypothetical protein APY03_7639 [Variovorax sp. WDL1]
MSEKHQATVMLRQTDPDPDHPSVAAGGIVAGPAPTRLLQLVAAVDAQDDSPSCDDLINFIVGRGPVVRERRA